MSVAEIKNESFSRIIVDLDNKRFFGCKFTNCTLRYAGGQCEWDQNCAFESCSWELIGAAARTLRILGLGPLSSFNWNNRYFSAI